MTDLVARLIVSETESPAGHGVSFREAFHAYPGGGAQLRRPAAQIAVMHRIIADERKWVSDKRFLHALNYCMLLPGPEAQQASPPISAG